MSYRQVYDSMMNNSSEESASDDNEMGFVEDLKTTKRQISGGGRAKKGGKKRARSLSRSRSPAKKGRKSKSPAKKKGRKSKSPAKKKGRKSKSPAKKARKSKSPAKKKKSPKGIPTYPPEQYSKATKRRWVYEGKAQKTGPGGLVKSQLIKSASGKIVSKAMSQRGKANSIHTGKWITAVKQANEQMVMEDPSYKPTIAPRKGTRAYRIAKEIMDSM